MNKIFYLIFIFIGNIVSAQTAVVSDTIRSDMVVTFNKLKSSDIAFSTASFRAVYVPKSDMVVLYFRVPSYIVRYKSTLSDYCIFETKTRKIKLVNQKEIPAAEGNISFNNICTQNYFFVFTVKKHKLVDFLNEPLKQITFYIPENEQYVKQRLSEERFMHNQLKKHFAITASIPINYKLSKPNMVKYDAFLTWLRNL